MELDPILTSLRSLRPPSQSPNKPFRDVVHAITTSLWALEVWRDGVRRRLSGDALCGRRCPIDRSNRLCVCASSRLPLGCLGDGQPGSGSSVIEYLCNSATNYTASQVWASHAAVGIPPQRPEKPMPPLLPALLFRVDLCPSAINCPVSVCRCILRVIDGRLLTLEAPRRSIR